MHHRERRTQSSRGPFTGLQYVLDSDPVLRDELEYRGSGHGQGVGVTTVGDGSSVRGYFRSETTQ